MKHKLQYGDDGPDWCVHCGRFAHYIASNSDCDATELNKWDATKPDVQQRFKIEILRVTK